MASTLSFDREFAEQYGITAALLYQELRRKYYYWKKEERLVDGFFWCNQGVIAEWLLVSTKTIERESKKLEEAGLIKKKVSYRPGTHTTTTWWQVVEPPTGGQNDNPRPDTMSDSIGPDTMSDSILNQNTEATTPDPGSSADGHKEEPRVVFLKVNPSGRAWKSQRVYSTDSEIDRLEGMDDDDAVNFKYWKSPNFVGDEDKAKFKRMKVKLVQPDVVEEEKMVEYNGKKYKTIKGGEVY